MFLKCPPVATNKPGSRHHTTRTTEARKWGKLDLGLYLEVPVKELPKYESSSVVSCHVSIGIKPK